MVVQISKKKKSVADGLFKAELNKFLTQELAEDVYSGVKVQVIPTRTEIIILATRTQNVLREKGYRIWELTVVVQKRISFPEGSIELYAEKVATRGLLKIVLSWDPSDKTGPKKPLPDHVSIVEPKDKGGKPEPPTMPQPVPTA
uniref:KH type-2 domain-containing protein n=1 Tax=Jaculus jaculus TaxID=51337 RepID=A0A8C5LIR3_JACJA